MKQVRLRLIYPFTISQKHVDAAEAALRPFRRAGALVESVCVDDDDAFKGVRNQKPLRSITSARGDIRLDTLPRGILGASSLCFGIALTPHRMVKPEGGRMAMLSCSAEYMGYAALSLFRLSQPESPQILAAMAKRQAARLFIHGHRTGACIMSDIQDFTDRFVMLGFCNGCREGIEEKISRLKTGK